MEHVGNDLAFEAYALSPGPDGARRSGVPTKDDWDCAVLGRAEAVSRGSYQGRHRLSTATPEKADLGYDPAVRPSMAPG